MLVAVLDCDMLYLNIAAGVACNGKNVFLASDRNRCFLRMTACFGCEKACAANLLETTFLACPNSSKKLGFFRFGHTRVALKLVGGQNFLGKRRGRLDDFFQVNADGGIGNRNAQCAVGM